MESSIFFGGSVIAAVVAGMLALFAPCCISFMLPAYFASSFQNRLRLVAMTFLFAAGVATIILPIALGASLLRQLFAVQHMTIYVIGGVLLLGLAIYLLLGGQIHLPMLGQRAGGKAGILTTYTLGIFSGITSSCCAPVLAGVIALASVAPSFLLALGLGTAYVFGMVAPLFVISLLWEHYNWKSNRLFHPKSFTWHLGPMRRTLGVTNLFSGLLLLLMGGAMIWVGLTSTAMTTPTGWQATFFVWLQHVGQLITGALAWLPNWVVAPALILLISLLARRAFKQGARMPKWEAEALDDGELLTGEAGHDERRKEKIGEHETV
ncbi:MAG TPA: cytochrome c biogenesis CcdA family protein [Ktedonobacteraceae bacterium]|nr:cytochrome c biogenesis CcdA family protein [Ktedonobacteraceae bacterium]